MASAVPYKFTTTSSTNLQPVRAGQTANVTGISVANVATAIYIKLYWTNTGVTVGTTVPAMTIGVAASANVLQMLPPVTGNGELWVAVTGAAADSDSTSAAVGAVVTLFVE